MKRRQLLQLGVAGAAVLGVGTLGVAWVEPGLVKGRLTHAGHAVLAGICEAVLDGSLPTEPSAHLDAVAAHLRRLDDTIAGLPSSTREELSQLMALLAHPLGRWAFAGLSKPWAQAGTADLQRALQTLRSSSLSVKQQAYHALRDLTNAAFYADESAWPLLAYPGPRDL